MLNHLRGVRSGSVAIRHTLTRWAGPCLSGCALLVLATGLSSGQQSASYKLEEWNLNSGGHPRDGVTPLSPSFRLSLDALDDGVMPVEMSGASFTVNSGLTAAYAPPGEVTGLVFADLQTLVWNPESSAGLYNLYKGDLAVGGGGNCEQPGIPVPTSTESSVPATGSGWFYLVTVENRLGVEGTQGDLSSGMERTGGPCP